MNYERDLSPLERESWIFFLDGTILRCCGYERLTRPSIRRRKWIVVACSGSGRRNDPGYTEDAPVSPELAATILDAFRATLTIAV